MNDLVDAVRGQGPNGNGSASPFEVVLPKFANRFAGIKGLDFSGAVSLANAIRSCHLLSVITFGNAHVVTMEAEMMEADFSGKKLGSVDAIIMAGFLPKCR